MCDSSPLGIITGRGSLPQLLVQDARAAGRPYHILAFEGLVPDWTEGHPRSVCAFEKLGGVFAALEAVGCREVVFAGAMDRPRLNPLKFDKTFTSFAARLLPRLKEGDDALLRTITEKFEEEGFKVLGADQLASGLLAEAGVLGAHSPDAQAQADATRAAQILAALAPLDIGQGAVVAQGLCLGIETLQGTDALLAFAATGHERLPETLPHSGPRSGVLLKLPKTGQERRADLPAIGPETVRGAAEAGLAGIAIAAGGVLLLGRADIIAEADRLGLFLWARGADDA